MATHRESMQGQVCFRWQAAAGSNHLADTGQGALDNVEFIVELDAKAIDRPLEQ